jgi:hypothetical protein
MHKAADRSTHGLPLQASHIIPDLFSMLDPFGTGLNRDLARVDPKV